MRRSRKSNSKRDNGIQQAMTESCWRWFLYHLLKLAITSQSVQSVDHISRYGRERYPNESRNDAKRDNNNCRDRRPSAESSLQKLARDECSSVLYFLPVCSFCSCVTRPSFPPLRLLRVRHIFALTFPSLRTLSDPPFCGTLLYSVLSGQERKNVSCLPLYVRSTQMKGQGRQESQDTEEQVACMLGELPLQ